MTSSPFAWKCHPDTHTLTVDFDVLLKNTISDHQLLLAWNTVLLYPRDVDKRAFMIEPSVVLTSELEIWECAASYPTRPAPG